MKVGTCEHIGQALIEGISLQYAVTGGCVRRLIAL